MAALVEGQQYGLSAQDKINCNKSLVFVKLTDSALRSIEEYVKYKGNNLTKPTIEFQNNNGVITLPLHGSSQTYGFTLSNVEADGPQGSFECLRQNGHRSLESLGCMHMKMHIHANEDSYEKTRVKMAAAEQEHKKFCAKEIKPNGPHLGRKVKVKRPGLVVSPVKMSSPPTPVLPTKSTFKPLNVPPPPVKKQQEQPKFNRVNNTTTKNKFANSPELLRQPIRDRIIHILAVRPYKRPELLVRLMNEGIREKDRKGITVILTQVGTLKGNVYTLANYLWNEVQENWKFCTQEELEIIRKRKQQFQSSNNESDVPSPNNPPNCSPVQKRVIPEPVTTGQEPRSKKQRISHYTRPDNTNPSSKTEPFEPSASDRIIPPTPANCRKSPYSPVQVNGKSPVQVNSKSPVQVNSKSPIQVNSKSPVQVNGKYSGQDESSQKSPVGMKYDSYSNSSSSQKNYTLSIKEDLSSSSLNQRSSVTEDSEKNIRNHTPGLSEISASDIRITDRLQNYPASHTYCQSKESKRDDCSKTVTNGYVNSNSIKTSYSNKSSYMNRSKVTSTTNGSCSNSPHSSSDSRDSSDFQVPPPHESPSDFDCPEYVKEYGTIESSEQRAQYKADFNAQYEEYLRLHSTIKCISRRFATLEHSLHSYEEGSEEFKRIKGRIYKEYRAYQQDRDYIDALKKFNFLHGKLSHIKRLVMEYDNAQCVKS